MFVEGDFRYGVRISPWDCSLGGGRDGAERSLCNSWRKQNSSPLAASAPMASAEGSSSWRLFYRVLCKIRNTKHNSASRSVNGKSVSWLASRPTNNYKSSQLTSQATPQVGLADLICLLHDLDLSGNTWIPDLHGLSKPTSWSRSVREHMDSWCAWSI